MWLSWNCEISTPQRRPPPWIKIAKTLGKVVQIDDRRIQDHLGELVHLAYQLREFNTFYSSYSFDC